MDNYIEDIKQKILDSCDQTKRIVTMKNSVINNINRHMSNKGFNYYSFLENSILITEITNLIDDSELKKRFLKSLSEINALDFKDKVSEYNTEDVKAKKNHFLKVLREVIIDFKNTKYYKNPEIFINRLDSVGKDIVTIDYYFEKFLYRNGFSKEEVLQLISYICKCNMALYKDKIIIQNEKEIEYERMQEKKEKNKQERQRKKNLMVNRMSKHSNDLLVSIEQLIKHNFGSENDYDLNTINAYKDLVIDMVLNNYEIKEDMQEILLFLIYKKYNEIKELMNEYTEEELNKKLEFLDKAYNSYKEPKLKDEVVYEDSEPEAKQESDINVYYLFDEDGSNEFLNCLQKEKGDESFINGAKIIVEKLGKGIYEKCKKRPIDGFDKCVFVQQSNTFVSFIMLNEKNYILLAATKWDGLNYSTKHVFDNCQEQINNIKKKVAGDIK